MSVSIAWRSLTLIAREAGQRLGRRPAPEMDVRENTRERALAWRGFVGHAAFLKSGRR